jgi:hypothetical protein
MKEQDKGEFMVDRPNLIYGISFVGAGIIILILTIWIEPLITSMTFSQWFILVIRIVGIICIVAGIVGIIAALIPKRH